MNKFFIRYYSNTLFAFGDRNDHKDKIIQTWRFNFKPENEVAIYERLIPVKDLLIFTGLGFDLYINAETLDDALTESRGIVSSMLNLFALSSQAAWISLRLINYYDATEGIKDRKSKWFFYPTIQDDVLKSVRKIDKNEFSKIWSAYNRDTNNAFHILIAANQLNKGFKSDSFSDKYIEYWTGIEYLTDTLNDKFNFLPTKKFPHCDSCKQDILRCPHCNIDFKEKIIGGRFSGVKKVALDKLQIDKKFFDELYEMRSRLLKNPRGVETKYFRDKAPTLKLLLICSICENLDLPNDTINRILSLESLENSLTHPDLRFAQEVTLNELDVLGPIEAIDKQPEIVFENSPDQITINEKGELSFSGKTKFTYKANDRVKFNINTVEQWGPNNSGVKDSQLNIK